MRENRIRCRGLLLALCVATMSARAGEPVVVSSAETVTPMVELYTSEGCSSCPPADRFLAKLGTLIDRDFRAVPLAFHVDYWNRLGWPDPFSSSRYTERQRLVAYRNRQSSIYTPELVVSGREARNGAWIFDRIRELNDTPASMHIQLEVDREDPDRIRAEIVFGNDAGREALGYVAIYENGIIREIGGGENRGATLYHEFVVRYWSEPYTVDIGESSTRLEVDIGADWGRKNLGMAVVAVDPGDGATLQAVRTPLDALYKNN